MSLGLCTVILWRAKGKRRPARRLRVLPREVGGKDGNGFRFALKQHIDRERVQRVNRAGNAGESPQGARKRGEAYRRTNGESGHYRTLL